MQKGKRRSLIITWIDRLLGRFCNLFAKSRILLFLSHLSPSWERSYRAGGFWRISDAETDRSAWQYRFRRACLEAGEKSALLRLFNRFFGVMLSASMDSYGSFGILYGGISAALWFLKDRDERALHALLASLILLVVSLPLLQTKSSLSNTLCHSVLCGKLLFALCMLPRDRFEVERSGRERLWSAFLLAVLLGGLSYWVSPVPVLVAILILLVICLALSCPELPVLLLLMLLPFFSLLPHPTVALCVGVVLCTLAWLRKALCGRRRLRFGLIDLTVLLVALLFLMGGIVGNGGRSGLISGLSYFAVMIFWFPAISFFTQPIWKKRALSVIRFSASILSFLGIFQYFFTDLELKWTDTARFADIGGRVCGTFSNPNIFAVYLVIASPFFLMGIVDRNRPFSYRLRTLCLLAVLGICVILTWSRGAWLGILSIFVMFLLLLSRRSVGLSLLSAPSLLLAFLYLPHSVRNRFSSIGLLSESSIRYRLYTWKGLLEMLRTHPYGIGVGDAAFHSIYPQYAVSGTETVMHAHQLFLQILAALGFSGLFVFLFFVLCVLLMIVYGIKHLRSQARAELIGCGCAVVGVLIMGLFDYAWYYVGNCFFFFTVCALLSVIALREED